MGSMNRWSKNMHKTRVYVDTSVFGGVRDAPFAEASKLFFERVRRGEIVLLLSQHTAEELEPPFGYSQSVGDGL